MLSFLLSMFTKNRQDADFHGSGTLFKPTRAPIVTFSSEMLFPKQTLERCNI